MMPPKRNDYRSFAPDILSNLPDNVIDIILMRLPCKEVVRTSVLSRKWRYNWCRARKFKFDESLWRTKKDLKYPTVKFHKIVYQLLTHHEGPITKFELYIGDLQWESCPNIDNFIYFLSKKDIQHLVLHFPRFELYKMPSLFICSQLRHLNLRNCIIPQTSAFYRFDRLISLELCEVSIASEFLGSIISRCSLLEQLVLKLRQNSGTIEINAPMLRSFDFDGNICSVYLKNVPLLAKLSLEDRSGGEPEKFDCSKFFKSCSALEDLSLSLRTYEEFIADEVPTRLPYDLNHVKRFFLIALVVEYKLECCLCLLRSLPHLEYLEFKVGVKYDGVQESLELEHFSDVTFNHLREIKLDNYKRSTAEKQFIKLLLAKSPVLMKMIIIPSIDIYRCDLKSEILAEISEFQCASPDAEIVYGYSD